MTKNVIFLIENEPSIAELANLYLNRAGYQIQIFNHGMEAIDAMKLDLPDLVIMDIMLPGLDGRDLSRWIRDRGDTPIILLTNRSSEKGGIAGLEISADDYLVKPINPQELVNRVRSVLRRTLSATQPIPDPPLEYGDLRINPTTRLVHLGEKEINLTAKEFEMLWLLARHPGQVFSREQLLESIWGQSEYIDPGTVTVHIRRLREKIESNPASPIHVITEWGMGYKFLP